MYELSELYLQGLGEINFFCTGHTGQYPSLYLVQNPSAGLYFCEHMIFGNLLMDFFEFICESLEIQYVKLSSVV